MKPFRLTAPIALLAALSMGSSPAGGAEPDQSGPTPPDAIIWYLGHCGYAIRTGNHLLIFDYIELEEAEPERRGLDEGFIDAAELAGLNVTVFVTHEHADHYDEVILQWQEEVESIEYVLGWEGPEGTHYHSLPGPRTELTLGEMEIYTVNSHHSFVDEVAYLVRVDGLTIYHGGDYQGRPARGAPSNAEDDMQYLRTKADRVDLFFIGAWTGDPYMASIRILDPGVIFPMHERGQEERYGQFATDLAGLGVGQPVILPERRGDRFEYSGGVVR